MSKVIEFLERMGQDAELRHAPNNEVDKAMAAMRIDPAVRAAITRKDQQALESLLGASTNVCCMIQADSGNELIDDKDTFNVGEHSANRVSPVV